MSKRDDNHYLVDMLLNGRLVVESTAGFDFQSFLIDREKQDAVAFRISIIGEAARSVTGVTRQQIADLPWPKITGMRHRIVHDYQDIKLEVIWRVATEHVPEMIVLLTRFLSARGIPTEDPDGPASEAAGGEDRASSDQPT